MIYPPKIESGDVIGIVAPAGRLEQNVVAQAVTRIEKMGYRVKIGRYLHEYHYNFSSSDENRLYDLQDMLDDESVKGIVCTRGGYGMIRIVEHLDFTKFRQSPKWIVGFSDITVLHAAIQKEGIASIHGPMTKSFLNYTDTGVDIDVLFSFLQGESPEYRINSYPVNITGKASGTLVGGNLSILHALRGTPFGFNPEGKILFLEDISEYLYHLDRMLYSFKLGGVFEKISGLVIGQFTDMKDNEIPFGETIEEMILKHVKDYGYPVAFNFPSGHIETNFPLILGDFVELNVQEDEVSLISL